MTFDKWMKKRDPKYQKTDDSVFLRGMRNAWYAAAEAEREACAKVCESERRDGEYRYNNAVDACADAIRSRSNV